ncbi:MAG: TonB-dependent receptor, partial [Flavobacteriales bacterium CG_4_9_14_3_um_filter_40_17]
FFGDAHLIYKLGNFKADFYGIYNAEVSFNNLAPSEIEKPYLYDKDENGNPFAPSWHTLNLRTQYRFNKYFSISADIENLTDRRYRPYSSGITAAGLNFIFSVRASL